MPDDDIDIARKLIVDQIAVSVVNELKHELERMDKVVSHNAKESIQYYPELSAVATELSYVLNIEYGRRKGSYPPRKPIVRWLQTRFGMSVSEAERVSYAVENKIYREGIPMTRFIKTAVQRLTR